MEFAHLFPEKIYGFFDRKRQPHPGGIRMPPASMLVGNLHGRNLSSRPKAYPNAGVVLDKEGGKLRILDAQQVA
jgi:hypothetical protein